MPTVTPILRVQKRDKRGRSPIWLRISDRDGDKYLSLGVKVLPSQWNDLKGRVRKGHPNSDRINLLLQRKETEAEEEILLLQMDDKAASADRLKESLTSTSAGDFFSFADNHLEDLLSREKVGRYRRLKATLKKLKDFSGPLPFDRITPAFLNAFETHCLQLGNKQSTVASNLSDVRCLTGPSDSELPETVPVLFSASKSSKGFELRGPNCRLMRSGVWRHLTCRANRSMP
jgi:hypothetical protein